MIPKLAGLLFNRGFFMSDQPQKWKEGGSANAVLFSGGIKYPRQIPHSYFYLSLDSTLDFDAAHAKVLATVLEIFAGPADKVHSSHVSTAFLIFKLFNCFFNFPFVPPGNLFALCATLAVSHPEACSSKDSPGLLHWQTFTFLPSANVQSGKCGILFHGSQYPIGSQTS